MDGLAGGVGWWEMPLMLFRGHHYSLILLMEKEKAPACNSEASFYHITGNVRTLCRGGEMNTINYLQSISEVSSEINILMKIYDIAGG